MPASRDWIRPIPNTLTVLRIVAAAWLPFAPEAARLPLVLFAGLSDWLDGFVARRFGVTSPSGALLDGIADKAFVLAAAVTFLMDGQIRPWEAALVMARDLCVGVLATICIVRGAWSAFGRMEARWPGKFTTAFVIPWFATLLLPVPEVVRQGLFVLAAGASVVAAADYARQFVRLAPQGLRWSDGSGAQAPDDHPEPDDR